MEYFLISIIFLAGIALTIILTERFWNLSKIFLDWLIKKDRQYQNRRNKKGNHYKAGRPRVQSSFNPREEQL